VSRRVGKNSEKVLRIVALYRKYTRAPTCQNLCLLAVRGAQVLLKATDCMLLLPVCVLCVLCVCVCVCERERERERESTYMNTYMNTYKDIIIMIISTGTQPVCVYVINILVACM